MTLSTVGGIGMWCLVVALPSIQQDLGITRADISFAYTMNTLGFFAGGVTWGRMVDKRGIVLTAILSATGLAIGFALAPLTTSLPLFAAVQVLIGFSAAATFAPLVADISHWFDRRRGIAVAIAASGNYLAGAIWPTIIQMLIHDHGWRVTYWAAGALCFVGDDPAGADLAPQAAAGADDRRRGNAPAPPPIRRARSASRRTACRPCWSSPASAAASPCRCRRSISSPTAPTWATAWRAARRCCR